MNCHQLVLVVSCNRVFWQCKLILLKKISPCLRLPVGGLSSEVWSFTHNVLQGNAIARVASIYSGIICRAHCRSCDRSVANFASSHAIQSSSAWGLHFWEFYYRVPVSAIFFHRSKTTNCWLQTFNRWKFTVTWETTTSVRFLKRHSPANDT